MDANKILAGLIVLLLTAIGAWTNGLELSSEWTAPPTPVGPAAIAEAKQADEVALVWWNIRDFSSKSRDDTELAAIAGVLQGADLVAIGELNDPEAIVRLARVLGPSWRSVESEKVGRSPQSAEHYGFLWNSEAFDLQSKVKIVPDRGDPIDRDPATATFRHTSGTFDCILMAVHVTWGDKVAARKAEIHALADSWTRVLREAGDERDLILMGDFNRNVGDDSFDALVALGARPTLPGDVPTTVDSDSTYDQIFLDPTATSEWSKRAYVIPFDETHFEGDDKVASKVASDHRPVWIAITLPDRDDD